MAKMNSLPTKETEPIAHTSSTLAAFQCETNDFVGISANNLIIHGDMKTEIHIHGDKNSRDDQSVMFQVKDPNDTFTGRNAELEKLHKSIQECRNQDVKISILSQMLCITGLGGIGKTEFLRMYIKKHGQEYDNIVWINAEHPSETIAQFKYLAEQYLSICVKEQDDKNLEFSHILDEVFQKLCQKPKRLLIIFDNAKALEDSGPLKDGIRQFLPVQTTAIEPPIVLVTSRHLCWKDFNEIKLDLWDTEECITYICKRLKLEDTPENRKDANEMALLFNRVPIAIEFAVSGIIQQSEQNRSIGDQDYSIPNLIAEHSTGGSDSGENENEQSICIEATVHKLLHASLEQIKRYEQGELAIQILRYMAYLSPTNIPKRIMHWLLEEHDEHAIDRALALLMRFSIIHKFGSSFTTQSVFQEVIIKSLRNISIPGSNNIPLFSESTGEIPILEELTSTFLIRLDIEDLTEDDHKEIMSNIIHTTEYINQHSMTSHFYSYIEAVAEFVRSTQCDVALKYYMALIECDIKILKSEPKDTFTKLEKIAGIYYSSGRYQNALEIFNTLLNGGEIMNQFTFIVSGKINISQGQEEVYGAHHPVTLETKNLIAYTLNELGKSEEALKIYLEVLKATEELFGPLHPNTWFAKHNLAFCLRDQGKPEEALELFNDLLEARTKHFGESHPDTLTTKNNVASCLNDIGKEEESLKIYFEVLEARENVLGVFNRQTLATKHNIASVLDAQGKTEAALKLYNDVLEAEETLLGTAHPTTLMTKNNVAKCLRHLGRTEEAIKYFKDVLEGREKLLGVQHPKTIGTKHSLALCLHERGESVEALKLFCDVLSSRQEVLGDVHPSILDTKYRIAGCLKDQGKIADALKLYYQILHEQNKLFGTNHTESLSTKSNIASCLCDQGNEEGALKLYYEILDAEENTFGALHTNPLTTRHNIALCLNKQGKKDEALKLSYEILEDEEKSLGASHRLTLATKSNIALFLSDEGKQDEALNLHFSVLEEREKLFGALHPETVLTKHYIGMCLIRQGNEKQGMKFYYDVLKAREKTVGALHPSTLMIKNNIACCLSQHGKEARALKLYFDVLEGQIQVLGNSHPLTLMTKNNIAVCLNYQGKHEEALKFYYEVLQTQEELLGSTHPDTLHVQNNIARCLSSLGKQKEAAKLFKCVLEAREKVFGPLHPTTLLTKSDLSKCLGDL